MTILPIPGFCGYYVSDSGDVYSTWLQRGNGSLVNGRPLKQLRPKVGKDGRLSFHLTKNGKKRSMRPHVLVLITFIGPRPTGMEGCHFPDPNPKNNNVSNLMWGTPADNQRHRVIHGTSNQGSRNPMSRRNRDARAQRTTEVQPE